MKYYPSWLPGGQFHKDAEYAKIAGQQLRHAPFNMVRDQMVISHALCNTTREASLLDASGGGDSVPILYIHAFEPTTTGRRPRAFTSSGTDS